MARDGGRRRPRLGVPFLGDGSAAERLDSIADEVEAYLAAAAGRPIPGKEDAGDKMPEPLEWLLRVERWGLPHGQGFINEPYHYMQDLEWADIGRSRFELTQNANRRNRERYNAT